MSARLDEVKRLILPARTVADVGCDHGLIAEYCVNSGMFESVIASDISEKCLQKAVERLSGKGVIFKVCDGLGYDCDEAVIAGMGGITIADIIRRAAHKPQTLVLCPHTDAALVRRTLIDEGYGIDKDIPLLDRGRFYSVIRALLGGGNREPDRLGILFGDCVTPSEAIKTHLRRLHAAYGNAPQANVEKLNDVREAMRLQNMDI